VREENHQSLNKTCESCRYWSEQIVRCLGPKHPIEAICLNREGQLYLLFCRGARRCSTWQSDIWGRSMTLICQTELIPNYEAFAQSAPLPPPSPWC
jgi:hypothetical protein